MKKETQPILYTYDSGIPGPTVVISAGVHGDEIGGVMALEYAQENFTIKKGVVHYLVVNPPAIEEGRRLININRICARDISGETYEYRNAAIIMNLLDTADMLLDLHAFSDPLGDAFVITVTRDVGKVICCHIIESFQDYITMRAGRSMPICMIRTRLVSRSNWDGWLNMRHARKRALNLSAHFYSIMA